MFHDYALELTGCVYYIPISYNFADTWPAFLANIVYLVHVAELLSLFFWHG